MVDPQVVRDRLRILGERITLLRELSTKPRQAFTALSEEEALAERHFQVAIQACIDVGNHLIREHSDRIAREYHEIFPILGELGVLEIALAERLTDAARFRDVLVHMYQDVDPGQVYDHLASIEDLDAFARQIEAWVEREESSG